jgi:hypothetical protein
MNSRNRMCIINSMREAVVRFAVITTLVVVKMILELLLIVEMRS